MSSTQFFDQLIELQKWEDKMAQTTPTDDETFTVEFHVDSGSNLNDGCLDIFYHDTEHKVTASQHDPNAICVIVKGVDSTLIDSLQDDELAEFFGIDSEGLIYTNRGEL